VISIRNREKVGLWVGAVIALIGLAGIVLPSVLGVDMMGAGYGLGCLGVFFVIMGLVTLVLYGLRYRTMARILSGDDLLARWTYSEPESRQQVEAEYADTSNRNRVLFLIMLFWFVVIGGAILAVDYAHNGELNGAFAGIMLGCVLLLGFVAWLAPRAKRRQARRATREVIISRLGFVLNDALYTWGSFASTLAGVGLDESPDGPALEFAIRYPSRMPLLAYSSQTVRVPVPPGQLAAARLVVRELGAGR
jgi:hypothetical protein